MLQLTPSQSMDQILKFIIFLLLAYWKAWNQKWYMLETFLFFSLVTLLIFVVTISRYQSFLGLLYLNKNYQLYFLFKNFLSNVVLIIKEKICKWRRWDKLSFLSHSLISLTSFLTSARQQINAKSSHFFLECLQSVLKVIFMVSL